MRINMRIDLLYATMLSQAHHYIADMPKLQEIDAAGPFARACRAGLHQAPTAATTRYGRIE